jgi:hypothetical protein
MVVLSRKQLGGGHPAIPKGTARAKLWLEWAILQAKIFAKPIFKPRG